MVLLVGGVATPAEAAEELEIVFPHDSTEVEFGDEFGIFAKGRIHQGIDVFSPKGDPVVAVADGFLVKMGRAVTAGFYVEIRHAYGFSSLYLHMNNDKPGTDDGRGGWLTAFAPDLAVGDYVEQGQVVGYVGDSGNAEGTSPQTHFELHRWGRRIDPYPLLSDAWDAFEMRHAIEAGETPFR